jgi:hypothetical protein
VGGARFPMSHLFLLIIYYIIQNTIGMIIFIYV